MSVPWEDFLMSAELKQAELKRKYKDSDLSHLDMWAFRAGNGSKSKY